MAIATDVLVCFLAIVVAKSGADLCEAEYDPNPYDDPSSNETLDQLLLQEDERAPQNRVIISCPRTGDPPEYVLCCYGPVDGGPSNDTDAAADGGEGLISVPRCCPPPEPPSLFPFITDKVALIVAISITAVLAILTVSIVFCCFSPRCPLYMACRVRYRPDDIIAYASKDEESAHLNAMPPEEKKGVHIYAPNAVKVTKTLDE